MKVSGGGASKEDIVNVLVENMRDVLMDILRQEIMEEGEMSRQMAIIDNWQGLDRIGNIRSCRDYYISLGTAAAYCSREFTPSANKKWDAL